MLEALRVVHDPDLHGDVVSLGFIRDVRVDGPAVSFELRLTTPACPARESLTEACRVAVAALPGVGSVDVRVTARTVGGLAGVDPADALGGVKHLVAVASGKGGVGKSTVAVNLAWALQAAGARVGLVDADVHGPSLQHLTGAGVPTEQREGRSLPPEVDGVAVVSMAMFVPRAQPALLRGPRVSAVVQQLLTSFAWGERDYLLVDCPPGTGDVHLTLAQVAPLTGVVLVTTPQETALLDVRKAVTMYRQLDVPILGVVETMAGFLCPSCDVLHPIFGEGGGQALADELGVPLLARVPLDPAVAAGGERARPVVVGEPDAASARALAHAAGRLAALLSVRAASPGEALDSFRLVWRRG